MAESPVYVATTLVGDCLVRLVGRATLKHSPPLQELAQRILQQPSAVGVALDLTACTYLDSTFLGCIYGLYRKYGSASDAEHPARFRLHAPASIMKELFGPMRLDRIMKATDAPLPAAEKEWVALEESPVEKSALTRHVMECHRRLAETDSPAKAAFQKIADAMEKELEEK